jgi:hypothetical protein
VVVSADVFVLVVREVLARDTGAAGSLADFVVFRAGFSGPIEDPRRRVWRDSTVESEHVVVDRTACLTVSVREFIGKTVTAMSVV